MAAGLYIHIPFCFSKCPYCDFYSTKYTPTAADAFAEKLGGQMQDYTGSFDTVYFGGGTPSILEPQVLTGILQAVRDHFTIDPAAEITVECNPSKDLTRDMEQYAAAGINRVSIGMQSAVDQERFALGRRAGSGEVARTVAAAKAAGITNISLDVMLGTPKQTPDSLEETFAFIARMQVTHISAYLLKIEPGTPLTACKPSWRCRRRTPCAKCTCKRWSGWDNWALPSTRSATLPARGTRAATT